jgi:hypothetical protein
MCNLFRHQVPDRAFEPHEAANGSRRDIERDPLDIVDRITGPVNEPFFLIEISELMEDIQRQRRTDRQHHRIGTLHHDNVAKGKNIGVFPPGTDVAEGIAPYDKEELVIGIFLTEGMDGVY